MLAPNTLLQDRYLVMRLLGQGGMGAVYQATDRKFGNAIALKETFYSDDQLRKAFSQEARLLNRLRHAALPVVMDYFAMGDRQFLVMQYIPGDDLEQLLADRKASGQGVFLTSQVLLWAEQLLDALEYLHSQRPPIIHRDIKPQNLKLTPRGEVILLDFGLAKGITAQASQSSESIRGYTPNYASLEQIRGTGTDARSDIYSMGATLYHLLTGIMPQDAMTRIAALLMAQPDPLVPINQINQEVPPVVAAVIEKAMSPHPDKRFASAAIMRQALRNAGQNIPTGNLHRQPTLTDVPKSNSGQISARLDPRPRNEARSARLVVPAPLQYSEAERSTDHCIILLEEGKQKVIERQQEFNRVRNSKPPIPSRPSTSQARQSKSLLQLRTQSRPVLYALIAVGLIVGVGSTGRWLLKYEGLLNSIKNNFISSASDQTDKGEFKQPKKNPPTPARTIPVRIEAMRYHLEVQQGNADPRRATGLMPIAAGSQFKFHFKPRDNGYLYIIALGTGGTMQTFLTNRPVPASGLETNRVEAGKDFQFPNEGQSFMMPNNSETTPFTVILSPTPLQTPSFLSADPGRNLTEREQKELIEFRKRLATNSPELVAIVDNNQPSVTVQLPAERPGNQPLVFDISLKRK
jgi:serine/threonine protein kinase